jgi:hypothetical protein
MTREEIEILLREDVRTAIDKNIERDPVRIALDSKIPHAREVATQVKYLQRARTKLPALYSARCIIPQRAFEQSSSEQCAAAKRIEGETLLDLTCGLGIDSMAFAERFKRVIAIERDEVLAEVVRENLRRLNITNIEVVTSSAEDYLASCKEQFDWVYADPDRRTTSGQRVFRVEDCSPDMLSLMPLLGRISERVAIKLSPLFDVEEAFRLFGRCGVEVVSVGGECKEVMVYIDGREPELSATAVGVGSYALTLSEAQIEPSLPKAFSADYEYLIIPDVALQKARLVRHALRGNADVWSNLSFGFAHQEPAEVLGRVESIKKIEPFDLKALKREMKGCGVDILVRDFPMGVDEVRRKCSMRSGNEHRIALMRIGGKCYTIHLA